jgi:hypothetical protein
MSQKLEHRKAQSKSSINDIGPDDHERARETAEPDFDTPQNLNQLLSPSMIKNVLETPAEPRTKCDEPKHTHVTLSGSGRQQTQSNRIATTDDPLLNMYVKTPDTAATNLSSSLFVSSPTNSSSFVSLTSIESSIYGFGGSSPEGRRALQQADTIRSYVQSSPFSPSMLLTKYEQHKRRSSINGARQNATSLVAPSLASNLFITGQTKTSTKEVSSTTLDGDHVPLRKRIRLEESQQSKTPFLTTATGQMRQNRHQTGYPSPKQPEYRPLPRPPSLPSSGRISDFLRTRRQRNSVSAAAGVSGGVGCAPLDPASAAVVNVNHQTGILPAPKHQDPPKKGGKGPRKHSPSRNNTSGFPLPRIK